MCMLMWQIFKHDEEASVVVTTYHGVFFFFNKLSLLLSDGWSAIQIVQFRIIDQNSH